MHINAHSSYSNLGLLVSDTLADPKNASARSALAGCTMTIGPAGHPDYSPDGDGVMTPSYVGDSSHVGQAWTTPELDAIYKAHPEKITAQFNYNRNTKKFDMKFGKVVNDSVNDSLNGPLVAAHGFSPSAVSWFPTIFKRPLIWSRAKEFVSIQGGSDPWAEVMSMQLADFSGMAALPTAGNVDNQQTGDVSSVSSMMSTPIINLTVSYKLTIEEMQRAQSSSASPFAGQLIAMKQKYATWAMDIITDYMILYGHAPTGTIGLLTVNGVTAWATDSLTTIAASASTTKGADAVIPFMKAIASFMTASYNMFNKVRIGVSPLANNLLASMPYSSTYNPNAALKILYENFLAGEGKDGVIPDIEIVVDPLLSASTLFNTNATDYLVISAPEIVGGPDETPEPLLIFGAPLMDFVYPVTPGSYNTSCKSLRRVAGIFAPYTAAVKVYSGFGV